MSLKPCPCGKTPLTIGIYADDRSKWAFAYGDCCGAWNIEFRANYLRKGSPELTKLAIDAWNEAPRQDDDK